jgi:hypothetical protein
VTDLTALSAREAAARVASGSLTAEALVRACLDRIGEREATTGAWHYLDPDRAIAEARQRDRAPRRGPLHGGPRRGDPKVITEQPPPPPRAAAWRADRRQGPHGYA